MVITAIAALGLALPAIPQQRPDVIWTQSLEGTTARGALDACFSETGGIFTLNAGSSGFPVHLFSYDADFRIFSARQIDSNDYSVESICSDGADGVFAVGTVSALSSTGGPPLGDSDILLMRFSRTGVLQWAKRYGGSGSDTGRDLCRLPSGDLLLAGASDSTDGFAGTSIGPKDGVVMRVTDVGDEVWASRGGDPSRWTDFTRVTTNALEDALCIGPSNNGWSSYPASIFASFSASGDSVDQGVAPSSQYQDVVAAGDSGDVIVLSSEFQWSTGYVARISGGSSGGWYDNVVAPGSMTASPFRLIETSSGEFVVLARVDSGPFDGELIAVGYSGDGTRSDPHFFRPSSTGTDYVNSLITDGHGTTLMVSSRFGGAAGPKSALTRLSRGAVSVPGCSGQPNSTGVAGRLWGIGSDERSVNRLTMAVDGLPQARAGYLLVSRNQGFATNPGGSSGDICLGRPVGRFARAGEIWDSGDRGSAHIDLDLADLPSPLGTVAAASGETWWFQAWYQDLGAAHSFSNSVGVMIR